MANSLWWLAIAVFLASGCGGSPGPATHSSMDASFKNARELMVRDQLQPPGRGIRNERVLGAMREIPRHAFVPSDMQHMAYADHPLPIGHGQTISQPYIVAFMTEQLNPQPEHRVLEVGTGSGYQAAVLSRLVGEVYSIEIVDPLARQATDVLRSLGITNVHVRAGDGSLGWPEAAPFDAIIVTCAPEHIPVPLTAQLKEGGRMIIPVGPALDQKLYVLEKRHGAVGCKAVLPVRFVPMTGPHTR